jgi:UDP:flavonoid glycosyltransferase YjiC (YdhE family)
MFKFTSWVKEEYQGRLSELFLGTDEASRGADLLLNSLLSFAGYHVAQKHALPALATYLQPALPSRYAHSMNVPPPPNWLPLKGMYNYLSTKIPNQMFFQMLRSLVNESRKEVLELEPLSFRYYWGLDSQDLPAIFGYSPSVIPKPQDWGELSHVTGYWFLDQVAEYQPPIEVEAFLDAGPPPVYIGFGSMVDHEQEEITRLIFDALELAECRAVLLGGWSELGSTALPETVLKIDYAPHEWLFLRMAAVVHHGGAGTTAAGLRAGVPSIIVPFFGDQFYWGWRVAALNAGPSSIPRKELTAEKLADAIRVATTDKRIQDCAGEVGERIRSEDGVSKAVEVIERYPLDALLVK